LNLGCLLCIGYFWVYFIFILTRASNILLDDCLLLWIVFLAIVGGELIFVLHEGVTVWTLGNFSALRVDFINFFLIRVHTARFLNIPVLILQGVSYLVVNDDSFLVIFHSIRKQVRLLALISTFNQAIIGSRNLRVAILGQFLLVVEVFYTCHMHFHCVQIAAYEHLMRTPNHGASLNTMISGSNKKFRGQRGSLFALLQWEIATRAVAAATYRASLTLVR